jgi:hypothetical protein
MLKYGVEFFSLEIYQKGVVKMEKAAPNPRTTMHPTAWERGASPSKTRILGRLVACDKLSDCCVCYGLHIFEMQETLCVLIFNDYDN